MEEDFSKTLREERVNVATAWLARLQACGMPLNAASVQIGIRINYDDGHSIEMTCAAEPTA